MATGKEPETTKNIPEVMAVIFKITEMILERTELTPETVEGKKPMSANQLVVSENKVK